MIIPHLLEYLKKNHYQSYFFGLGFIQIKVNEEERYHFYHPKLSAIMPEEEIHDHRYDFTSHILKGCLRQTIYQVIVDQEYPYGDWLIRQVSCNPDKPAVLEPHLADVSESITTSSYAGSVYTIKKDTFHRVEKTTEPTITFVKRSLPIEKEFAWAVAHKDSKEVCPFSPNMTEDAIWEWVEKICYE